MTSEEYYKIMHLMDHGALHNVDTGRLDGKCEDVIPLEDATTIIDSVYKAEIGRERTTREEAKKIIEHILDVTPDEPPTDCDNDEEWLCEDRKIRKALNTAIKALEDCGVLASEEQPSVTPTGTETVTESEETKDTITVLQTLREDVIKYRDNKANDFDFLIGVIFEIAAINGVIHIIDKLIAEIKNK